MISTSQFLNTERLTLRSFVQVDASRLAQLAGNRNISDTMISVPHPYSTEQASSAITGFLGDFATRRGFHYAMVLRSDTDNFVGYIALKDIDWEHRQTELSFWLDSGHTGRGYVTEAGRAMLVLAFEGLELNRVCAYHMRRNPASGKVLNRLGFAREGCLRQRVMKWNKFEDACVWAKLRQDPR